jgi:uncharacterized membrane protein
MNEDSALSALAHFFYFSLSCIIAKYWKKYVMPTFSFLVVYIISKITANVTAIARIDLL